MDVSILIPGIRPHLWKKVCDSIAESFSGTWEVIFVGPQDAVDLRENPHVRFIQSYASPMVCRQMALCEAKGDYICYAADDVWFVKGAIDEAFLTLAGKDYMNIVVGKYAEGVAETWEGSGMVANERYWYLNFHDFLKPVCARFPNLDPMLINTGLIPRALLVAIGGFDCQFDCCAMGCCDLSLRLQIGEAKCTLQSKPFFCSTHLMGESGDHAPIHNAQTQHDMPLFLKIWQRPEALHRTVIELDNWRHYPQRWERRFGKS